MRLSRSQNFSNTHSSGELESSYLTRSFDKSAQFNLESFSGIVQIYQIAINWDSVDAACLQRLEIQTPHQRLRLIKDFTPAAKQSTLGRFFTARSPICIDLLSRV